jgi:hypothetical protein
MITNRDVISRIRSTHRLLSADGSLNDRAVFAEIKGVAPMLIKRELNLRKLVATDSIYTTLPCLELTEVSISECCAYTSTKTIARTKIQLPRIGESNYLYAIKGVFSIDQQIKLKEITPSRYINLLKLPVKVNEHYYWVQNNFLYVTNPELEKIKLVAYFEETVPLSLLYPSDCDCTVNTNPPCTNPLDEEFKCPMYLVQNVVDITSKNLLQSYFRLPEDRQSDNVDGQAPNQAGK